MTGHREPKPRNFSSSKVLWSLVLTAVLARAVYTMVRAHEFTGWYVTALAVPVVAAVVLARQRSLGPLVYIASVLTVFGSAVVGGIQTVRLAPTCSGQGSFTSWADIGERWFDVAVAVAVFAALAANIRHSPPDGEEQAERPRRAVGVRAVLGGFIVFMVIDTVADNFVHLVKSRFASAWTDCQAASSDGVANVALKVALAAVSGPQEEIVFTGVGLLVVAAAPIAGRGKTIAAVALVGGVLRALPHMYYTTDAAWYSILTVTGWATAWSAGTLIAGYLLLRLLHTAHSLRAIALMTLGVAVSHSAGNSDELADELQSSGNSLGAGIAAVTLSLICLVGFFGGLWVVLATIADLLRADKSDDAAAGGPAETPGIEDTDPAVIARRRTVRQWRIPTSHERDASTCSPNDGPST